MKRKISMIWNIVGILSAVCMLWFIISVAEIAFYHPAANHEYMQHNMIAMLSDLSKK